MGENNNDDIKPNATLAEIEKILDAVYGLRGGPIVQLQGFDDLNFHCLPNVSFNRFTNGLWPHGYVLKVMNSLDSKNNALCEGQNELMIFLREQGIPCPTPVKTVNGRLYLKETFPSSPFAEGVQKEHIVRLFEFQPGVVLKIAPKSYSLLYQVGTFVAKLNEVLKKFSHPVYKTHYSIWHLKSAPEIKFFTDIIENLEKRKLVETITEQFARDALTKADTFEKGMIHGDLNENNILLAKSERGEWRVSAILDFGDSHESCYVFELAIALCYMMFECRRQGLDIVVGAGHFLAGYLTVRPHFSFDCGLLKLSICARICQSLLLGLKAFRLQPANPYVLESQEMGWTIVEELWGISDEKVAAEWEVIPFTFSMIELLKNNDQTSECLPMNIAEGFDEVKQQESYTEPVEATETNNQTTQQKREQSTKDMKFLRPKPNFFMAFQVNDPEIHQNVKKLQEKVISKNPLLNPALINVSTLHVTLAVTHLANNADVETIKSKLDEWAAKNVKAYFEKPCVLSFKGVKTFRNIVAYVDVEQCPNYSKLLDLSKDLNNVLSSAGYFTENKSFTPHLTFLKLSKDFKLLKKKKNFEEDFESLKNCEKFFGKQEVTNLQLLSMDNPKDEFGYYKCLYKIEVSPNELDENSSELTCSSIKEKPEIST